MTESIRQTIIDKLKTKNGLGPDGVAQISDGKSPGYVLLSEEVGKGILRGSDIEVQKLKKSNLDELLLPPQGKAVEVYSSVTHSNGDWAAEVNFTAGIVLMKDDLARLVAARPLTPTRNYPSTIRAVQAVLAAG